MTTSSVPLFNGSYAEDECPDLYHLFWRKEHLTEVTYKNLVALASVNSVAAIATVLLNASRYFHRRDKSPSTNQLNRTPGLSCRDRPVSWISRPNIRHLRRSGANSRQGAILYLGEDLPGMPYRTVLVRSVTSCYLAWTAASPSNNSCDTTTLWHNGE